MSAIVTLRSRRLLPLLALGLVLAASPPQAGAGMMTSRLTDRATLALLALSTCLPTAHVAYEAQETNQAKGQDTVQHCRPGALAALSLILVIPAGTMPEVSDTPPAPPPPQPPPPSSSNTPGPPGSPPGGGHTSGGPTPPPSSPEPGALTLALIGGATALLPLLRRRQR